MKKFLLKQKVAVLLITISIVSLCVTSVVVYFYVSKTLVDNKKNEIFTAAIEQSREGTLVFKNNKLVTHMLSTRTRVKEFLLDRTEARRSELLSIFSEYTNENKDYLAIYLLDKNGLALVSTDQRFVGQDYSFREYFKKAISDGSAVDVALGKTSNQLGYYFSEPVYNTDGSILGVMVVKVSQNDIDNSIIKSTLSKESILMIVDKFGVVVSTTEEDRRLKSLGILSDQEKENLISIEKYLDKKIISLQYDSIYRSILNYSSPTIIDLYDKEDKERELVSVVKMDNLPFYLIVETRLGLLNTQVVGAVSIISVIIFLVLIFISLFIFYFLKIFLRPVDKFISYFNSISNGNFSQRLEINTRDEFYDMADRVNMMAKDLSDLYKDLDSKVKEQTLNIESRVKESDDQNKAILNILEDVEVEKTNAERLAGDLEKFKLAVDNVSDQIVITDREGIVIYGNKAVKDITGFAPEEAFGKKAGFLWKVPMPIDYYINLWDVIKNQKKTFISEIQNKRKNGEIYTAIISISSVLDKNNEIIYFVAIEKDITREKEIDKAKTEFVSLASHQLRTPLSAINWYTEMLLAGDAGSINEEQRKYLSEVYIGNKRMVELVNDLLNVSRLDMGTLVGEIKEINVIDLFRSVLNEIKPEIIEKNFKVEQNLENDILNFSADEKLLRMVFQNILSNAVKYTKSGGLIKINLLKINKGDNFGDKIIAEDSLVFSVSDSGMGIPVQQQQKIFSKLFRADNAKESETEGTGLGLYVIKSIVDQSGGQVWFKSEENKGTTFYISFPLNGMKVKDKLV